MTTPSVGRTNVERADAQRAQDAGASVATRLAQRFDPTHVISDATALAAYEVDELRPAAALKARSVGEIRELLQFVNAEKLAVTPCGARTKLGIGAPLSRYDIALDLSRMDRVLAYEPRDLTLGVEPGVTATALQEALAREGQWLPIGSAFHERATIGGILAADSASPLRYGYGGPRDFTLGMEFVTGDASVAKSGGRVVKNVSGYDLHKLLIGSLGTLAVITRANFKTFPAPPVRRMFVARFAGCAAAMAFCAAIRKSPLDPKLVEAISPELARVIPANAVFRAQLPADGWSVVTGVAAQQPVVERHAKELAARAARAGASEFAAYDGKGERELFGWLSDFPASVLAAEPAAVIFRIATLPSATAALAERLVAIAQQAQIPHTTKLSAYGLTYFALLGEAQTATLSAIFRAATEAGATARIEWAPLEVKRAISVWGEARPDFDLMRRVKKVFDPGNVLSPRRFAGDA
jgi:glycolate oxidase FAD binding subunit